MALWEYKVITSGPHGFATPSLLEAHLNALGKDEWEIIHFQTLPNNSLAFNGLARRSTTRDWVPPEATVVAAPKPAAWEVPPPAPTKPAPAEEKPELPPALIEAEAPKSKVEDTKLRTVRDTERDQDPEALAEEDDWDNWAEEEDELPTLFEAIKPHLRRNQRGPGMSVAVDFLAKRWDQKEADIIGALKECGFTIPENEDADPDYFEFEGDLYWVNRNNRNQLFLNTREKPRPTFRVAQVAKLDPNDPAAVELAAERAAEKAEIEKRNAERAERQAAQAAAAAARAAAREQAQSHAGNGAPGEPAATDAAPAEAVDPSQHEPLPTGQALLDRIRPLMRRNRRGPGHSGSVSFLARALKASDADLVSALDALNLHTPASPNDKPVYVEIGAYVYWLNKDSRGGIWINGREKREGERRSPEAPAPAPDAAQDSSQAPVAGVQPAPDAPPTEVIVAAVVDLVASGDLAADKPAAENPVETSPSTVNAEGAKADGDTQPAPPPAEPADSATAESSGEDEGEKPSKPSKKPSRPRAPRKPRKPRE